MKKLIAVLAAISFICLSAQEETNYNKVSEKGITFEWLVKGESLSVKLEAPATGWVSVGFNPSKVMKGADFIIGYVEGEKVVIEDQYGSGLFSHKNDTDLGGEDNITEKAGEEKDGKTSLSFVIPLSSGDKYDSKLEAGKEVTVLLAYAGKDGTTKKHSKKAKVTITL